jgi:AcrR family transcriptional regulator
MPKTDERNTGPKGLATREKLLRAAGRLFGERGYAGTGIRDIEAAAGVQRGLATYHLGNKDDIWKAVAAYCFQPFMERLAQQLPLARQLPPEARFRFLLRAFVEMSADKSFLNQIMVQENLADTWRIQWLLEHYIGPLRQGAGELFSDDPAIAALLSDPHRYYVLLGACAHVFSLKAEARALYGADTSSLEFMDRHVDTVLALARPWLGQP